MAAADSKPDDFVKASHDFAQWMIGLADTKANILVAASAILAGLLVPQALRSTNQLAQIFLGLGVVIALVSTALSLLSVYPRTKAGEHSSLLYFRTIMTFGSWEAYHSHLLGLKADDPVRQMAQQTWELAQTQMKKYFYLEAGIAAFVVCIAATLLGVALALV